MKAIQDGLGSRKFRRIEEQARELPLWLDAAANLSDPGAVRGNRLEVLKRCRAGHD
jgi:hypothetical protein